MRTLWLLFRSVIIAACLLLSFTTRVHAQVSHPRIGEVAWAGSSLSSSDEWLELWNASANTTTLAGYKLRGASSGDIFFSESDVIPPYGAFLISNYGMDDEKSVLDMPPQIVTSTIALSNSALKIELIAPDESIIDTAGDGGTPPAGSSLPTKMSMIRQADGTWLSATTSTPGICDGCNISEPIPIPEPIPEPIPIPIPVPQTIEIPVSLPEPIQIISPVVYTPPLNLRLHAIFPAPESGSEWIEINTVSATDPTQAFGWSMKDGSSTIFRFQESTRSSIVINGNIWRITLPSARLNNSGDTVELIRPDGTVAERMIYPTTDRGKTWIKNPDNTAWIMDPPLAEIIIEDIETPILPTIELPTIEIEMEEVEETAEPTEPKVAAIKKAPKTTKPKTTNPKPKPFIIQTTINDMYDLESGVKIKLSGTVATKPDIIGKHQFILSSPDGHGLWVRATNKQPSPAQGSVVEVTGTLMKNDDGIYLKLSASDSWTELKQAPDIKTRVVDLLAADERDHWSFIEATGTVLEVKGQNVELDLNGVVVIARIKPATGYRAARLLKGDTLHVRGIVDLRGDTPIILPSAVEDIILVEHTKKPELDKPKSIPDWLPFGAAGITIAVTETVKRVRKLYRERQLRTRLALTNH